MASEIRVNKIENRSGLGTVTFADTGVDLAGIVTATTFSGSGASLTDLPAGNLSGTLPAISAANLTNVPAANITGTLPAISAANLTNVPAANITGTLPAISAANLTNVPAANITGTLPALTAANLTNIPAANLVGVCTSGLTKTGGFSTWVKLSTTTVTSDTADVTFTNSIDGAFDTYKVYAISYTQYRGAVDNHEIYARIIDSSGEYTGSEYRTRRLTDQGNYNTITTHFALTYNGIGNDTSGSIIKEDAHGLLYMYNLEANRRFTFRYETTFKSSSSESRYQTGGGSVNNTNAVTGVKLYSASGDIASGIFTLYGIVT